VAVASSDLGIRTTEKTSQSSKYIDTTVDVQQEPSSLAINAGVANLRVMYSNGALSFPVSLNIQTTTKLHRGVHMSRLVRAASNRKSGNIERWLRWICLEVNKTQPGSEVTCTYELPYSDQFARVTIRTTERGALTYQFVTQGITACPCSKKMIGIGHMQRAELTLILKSKGALDSSVLIERLEECFSAVPVEEMKRVEEAKKILEAQDNPRFAEDLVRECVKRFPNALFVSGRCFESIHAHDAVAIWSAKPGWMPVL
jgi:GTP cyclohydrolase FolE2